MFQNTRFSLVELNTDQHLESFASEVRAGLTAKPKRIPCRFFYDEAGSQIFEEICKLPEYYLTRAESEILQDRGRDVAKRFSLPISLVELGSGNSTKTRILIEALLGEHGAKRSLHRIPGFEDVDYDWVASAERRRQQAHAVVRRWSAQRRASGRGTGLGFLLTRADAGGANLTAAVFEELARARDDRPIEVRE